MRAGSISGLSFTTATTSTGPHAPSSPSVGERRLRHLLGRRLGNGQRPLRERCTHLFEHHRAHRRQRAPTYPSVCAQGDPRPLYPVGRSLGCVAAAPSVGPRMVVRHVGCGGSVGRDPELHALRRFVDGIRDGPSAVLLEGSAGDRQDDVVAGGCARGPRARPRGARHPRGRVGSADVVRRAWRPPGWRAELGVRRTAAAASPRARPRPASWRWHGRPTGSAGGRHSRPASSFVSSRSVNRSSSRSTTCSGSTGRPLRILSFVLRRLADEPVGVLAVAPPRIRRPRRPHRHPSGRHRLQSPPSRADDRRSAGPDRPSAYRQTAVATRDHPPAPAHTWQSAVRARDRALRAGQRGSAEAGRSLGRAPGHPASAVGSAGRPPCGGAAAAACDRRDDTASVGPRRRGRRCRRCNARRRSDEPRRREILERFGSLVRFTHPLLASTVYGNATEQERQEIHRRLARRRRTPRSARDTSRWRPTGRTRTLRTRSSTPRGMRERGGQRTQRPSSPSWRA